jgi:hypothetical protein
MKAYNGMLLITFVFLLFQCNDAEPQNEATEQKITQEANNEDVVQQQAETQAVAVAKADPIQANEVAKMKVPSVTIEPGKVQSAVSGAEQNVTSSKTINNDAPTVTERKSLPPPAPAPALSGTQEEQSTITVVEELAIFPPPNHALFDALLQKAVSSSGKVNYGIIKSSSAGLDAYIRELSNQTPDGSWSRNSAMAYWINAYNAFTLKLVADNYPINSIKDLHNGNPWIVKWIKLGDKTYSLDQIENEILRPRYGDARIHFAVNCAAKSCPPLHNRAFTENNLNSTLDRLTRNFINNKNYNTISSNQLKVSQIFNWYAKDFGTLTDFINRYTNNTVNANAAIEYKEYNWALNE